MKRNIVSICLLFSFMFSLNTYGLAQTKTLHDSANQSIRKAAREIMISAGTCTLITLDKDGSPRAREMDAFPPETDFTVWFGTNPKSRKVEQIKNDPRTTLYYLDSDRSGYVMLSGQAKIVNDSRHKEKYWKDEWNAFYSNKQEGFTLIKFTPDWFEVISNKRAILGDSISWEPGRIYINSKNN